MAREDRQADDMRALDRLRLEVDELRASRERLVLAADAERRGLERELHDGVQQHLVALAVNLELAARSVDADPEAAKELLAEMGRDVRDAMDQTRKLAAPDLPAAARGWAAWSRRCARRRRTRASLPASRSRRPDATRPRSRGRCTSAVSTCSSTPAGATVAITVRDDEGALVFDIVEDGDLHADRLAGCAIASRRSAAGCTIESESGRRTRVIGSLPLSG